MKESKIRNKNTFNTLADTFKTKILKPFIKNSISEKIFFLVCCLLNLWPIIGTDFYTTLDGPAHLYNSQLINLLLSDENGFISNYYQLNSVAVPNWSGHALMALMLAFLPAGVVEKMLAVILAVALPYAFRSLLKEGVAVNGIGLSYFIFPFTYSLTFLLGFYNFTIGLIVLFWGVKYWIINRKNISKNWVKWIGLIGITLILYFSHILPFLVFFLLIGCYEVANFYFYKNSLKSHVKNLIALLLASSFSFFCLWSFLKFRSSVEKEYLFLDSETLFDWIVSLRTLIVFNTTEEAPFTSLIFYSILALVVGLIIKFISVRKNRFPSNNKEVNVQRGAVFVVFLIFVLMYFILPDNDGVGGEIIPRIQWLMFVFLILLLSKLEFPKWVLLPAMALMLFAHFQLNAYYQKTQNSRGKFASKVLELEESIRSETLVHVVNLGGNWTYSHFSNILGFNKKVIVLKNYEADRAYFPIKWNQENMPLLKLGSKEMVEVYDHTAWNRNEHNASQVIDYIFVQGRVELINNDSLAALIQKDYQLLKKQPGIELYTLK